MKENISSAGILYLYIGGDENEGMLYLNQVDSYSYIGEELYRQIMKSAENSDKNTIHIFAIVGNKEKADSIYALFENELKENFHRILSDKAIRKSCTELDETGNSFFRCVQEFYCEQAGHFPKRIYFDFGKFIFGGIVCSDLENEEGDMIASALVDLWLQREKPMLCGKQLMTRSFFLRDFINRKVVMALPNMEKNSWRLLFEGGHQLLLDNDAPYCKETMHPYDLESFCSSNLQTTLLNPIYGYGKWLQPNDICEEWHKVFLYLCAVSDNDWNLESFSSAYECFLKLLEDNICISDDIKPFFDKELQCNVLLTRINDFRKFLKGDDEPVVSKDLHQTLNSRYVYMPYLWNLVDIKKPKTEFKSDILQKKIENALCEKDTYKKGTLWEDAATYMLENISGWKITGRRVRAGSQEIDISIANCSLDNELWQMGTYVLVECKNWAEHVDIH